MKINFTCEVFLSRMELKQFKREKLFLYAKLYEKLIIIIIIKNVYTGYLDQLNNASCYHSRTCENK